jgi:outer membrane receptor for ferrienterochelin and colicin
VFHTDFVQEDYFRNAAPFSRSYLNWAPQANLHWNRSRMESVRFNYSGATRQPSIEQLQPFRQNLDPLNVAIGNPNLKQEFSHNINLGYNNYKPLSGSYTYGNVGFTIVQDAINQAQSIDEQGRRTYQYINSGTNQSLWSYMGTGTKIKKLDMDGSINGNVSRNTYHGFVNGVDNLTTTNDYGLGFRLNKDWEKDDKMTHEIGLEVSGNYRQNSSTLSQSIPDYRSLQIELHTSNQLPWKLRFTSDVQANIRNRFSPADQRYNTVVWNATLSRKLLKRDAAEIRLSVFDILNQNLGFSRSVTNTVISEEAYTTIRRYGMLSFIWNFTSTPGAGGSDDS